MKRHLSILACLVLVAAMVFALASCNIFGKPEDEHTHSYENGVCGECGEKDPNYVPPHTHNFVEGKCECGEEDPNYVAPECEHAYGAPVVTKEATCTDAGERTLTCTLCGNVETSEIAPLGHTEETIEGYAPTCTATGLSNGKKCTVCNEITVEQTVINAAGHDYVNGQCSVCSEIQEGYVWKDVVYTLVSDDMDTIVYDTDGLLIPAGTDGFFTIITKDGSKVEALDEPIEFEDGLTFNQRLSLNGKVNWKDGVVTKTGMKITVPGAATVKIWWVCGGDTDKRYIAIQDVTGTKTDEVDQTAKGSKDVQYIDTLEIPAAGSYYISNMEGNNYYYRIEVTTKALVKEEPKNEIKVTTTDNNCFADKVTFTATESGNYTFTLPAGVGAVDAYGYDSEPWTTLPYFDPMHPDTTAEELLLPHSFSVDIAAGSTYEFYISAPAKNETYVIAWSVVEGEVGGDDPIDPPAIDYPLNANGNNEVSAEDITYVFTADNEGTLTLQFGGAIMGAIEFSYTLNGGDAVAVELSSTVTLDLVAGDKIIITVVAEGYSSITASFTGEQGGNDDPIDPSESDLSVGDNSVTVGEDQLADGVDLTFVVTEEGTYSFISNDLMAIVLDSNGIQLGRGQVSLAVGTYTVKLVALGDAGTFNVTISLVTEGGDDPVDPTEPDGSYENPFVIESFPYTGTANISAWGTVYYTFTASANGYITVNVTEGALDTLCVNDKNVSTLKYAVLAGNTYTITLYNEVESAHNVSVAFEAAELTADDYKSIINNSAANDADWNWSASFSQLDDGSYIVNVADGMWTSSYYYSYNVVFNADGSVSVTLDKVLDLSALWMENVGDEYVLANNYTLLLTPGDYGYTLEFVEGKTEEPTCEHSYFYACDKVCEKCGEITNPDATHTIVHVDAVAATCYENGNIEYWYCSVCGYAWADEALTQQTNQMNVVVPMGHAPATHVEAVAPTCYENGNIEYWLCEACGQAWLDADCTKNTNVMAVVLPMAHAEATHVAAKDATCTADGNIEYWICEPCGQVWLDEACTLNSNVLSVVLPAPGHDYVDYVCSVCGAEDPDHYFVVSNAEAAAKADGKKVQVTGVVISAEAWNTKYNNMSVTIKDANGDTLYIFRLATEVGLGDTITVKGVVGSYNGDKQIAAGATAVIDVVHGDNHTYAEGVCTVCGSKEPVAGETTVKCDFSTLAVGTQYADETNTFGDVTVSTHNKGCHFNTQLRLYDSSSNNGWAIITAGKTITGFKVNAGNNAATLNVYGSVDGETWTLIEGVATTKSYADHTVNVDAAAGYKFIKIDAVGAQIRVASVEITYQG